MAAWWADPPPGGPIRRLGGRSLGFRLAWRPFGATSLAYLGGNEWIWIYVLLSSAAFTAAFTRSGRGFGIDQWLLNKRGEPPFWLLW